MRVRYAVASLLFFKSLSALSGSSYARDNFRDIRWLGRGNTGVATITDGTAVFYNPGGIPLANAYSFTIANPYFAGNENIYKGYKNIVDASQGGSSDSISGKFAPFTGKPITAQGAVFPNISVPGFVAGFWDYMNAGIEYRNPVNPELGFGMRNDYGLVVGSGVQVAPGFGIGASFRYQKRRFADTVLTGGSVISGNTSLFEDLLETGEAWGLNIGTQYRRPINSYNWVALGATMEDVGYTRFRNQRLNGRGPVPQRSQLNLGSAYGFSSKLADMTFLMDIRQLTNPDLHPTKKIFLGSEFSLPLIDIRGGFFQGYWTAGLSLKILPLFDIEITSYGEEVDSAAGIRQSRMWMLGVRSGLELKKSVKRKKQRFTLENL